MLTQLDDNISHPSVPVRDIAARFTDGRLSTEKLSTVSDEELYELLVDVRGVGPVSLALCPLNFSSDVLSGQVL